MVGRKADAVPSNLYQDIHQAHHPPAPGGCELRGSSSPLAPRLPRHQPRRRCLRLSTPQCSPNPRLRDSIIPEYLQTAPLAAMRFRRGRTPAVPRLGCVRRVVSSQPLLTSWTMSSLAPSSRSLFCCDPTWPGSSSSFHSVVCASRQSSLLASVLPAIFSWCAFSRMSSWLVLVFSCIPLTRILLPASFFFLYQRGVSGKLTHRG
jgi:hypothetical protein